MGSLGNPLYTFTLGAITLTNSSGAVSPIASLTGDMGLFFNTQTGNIAGRPLQAGLLQIALTCTDANGVAAKSRDLSTTGQTITIIVHQNQDLGSEFFSTAITVKGDTKTGGKDSIQYSGVINIGDKLSTLNGDQVTFTIGDYTAPVVTLNGKGQGTTGKSKTGPAMKVSISSSNQIKITVTGESFGTAGSILSDITVNKAIVPVTITISNTSFISSELLKFGVKAKGTLFQMTYKFGPGNLGGGFLLSGVQGKDNKTGDGDFWKAGFVFIPPSGQKFSAAKTATVGIGSDFSNTIIVTNGNGKIGTGEKRGNGTPQIVKIGIAAQGKGFVQTSSLPTTSTTVNTATSIPTAATDNGKKVRFPLVITLNDVNGNELFGGEGAITIFSNGKGWQNKSK